MLNSQELIKQGIIKIGINLLSKQNLEEGKKEVIICKAIPPNPLNFNQATILWDGENLGAVVLESTDTDHYSLSRTVNFFKKFEGKWVHCGDLRFSLFEDSELYTFVKLVWGLGTDCSLSDHNINLKIEIIQCNELVANPICIDLKDLPECVIMQNFALLGDFDPIEINFDFN